MSSYLTGYFPINLRFNNNNYQHNKVSYTTIYDLSFNFMVYSHVDSRLSYEVGIIKMLINGKSYVKLPKNGNIRQNIKSAGHLP